MREVSQRARDYAAYAIASQIKTDDWRRKLQDELGLEIEPQVNVIAELSADLPSDLQAISQESIDELIRLVTLFGARVPVKE